MTTHPGGIARLLYYPPTKSSLPPSPLPFSEEQVGLGAHSDYECFTLLLSSSAPGLEILKPSGHWHIAVPPPDAFIVNVADFLIRAGEYILERLNATTKDGAGFFGNEDVVEKENQVKRSY